MKNNLIKKLDNNNNLNPKNIKLITELTKDAFSLIILENTFIVFNSVDNILYLIYVTQYNIIITFDVINKQKMGEIKFHHKRMVTNFRHYLDQKNNKDYFMSISAEDNNIRIWNLKNLECILNLENINKKGFIFSACFLNDNNNYIITNNNNQMPFFSFVEPIKLYDFKGQKIKEI